LISLIEAATKEAAANDEPVSHEYVIKLAFNDSSIARECRLHLD
jgi:hypothetical protein